jgi:hypothetical protein
MTTSLNDGNLQSALSMLEQRGYTDLAQVTGGKDRWHAAGGEVERGGVARTRMAIGA